MDDTYKYKSIEQATTGEFRDRGSKFFAFAYPLNDIDQLKPLLQNLKKEHPKAVHHCYAFRIGTDGLQFRANDDGEPSGSAGRPILGQIDSAGITNILVVVVRYFGGTLLGVPGLINAYKTATAQALEQATVVERWVERVYELDFDYSVMGEVMYLLRQSEATIHKQDLQLFCSVKTGIPLVHEATCTKRLSELRGLTLKEVKQEA